MTIDHIILTPLTVVLFCIYSSCIFGGFSRITAYLEDWCILWHIWSFCGDKMFFSNFSYFQKYILTYCIKVSNPTYVLGACEYCAHRNNSRTTPLLRYRGRITTKARIFPGSASPIKIETFFSHVNKDGKAAKKKELAKD